MVVAQCVARACAAPLIYFCQYVVDDEDAKGEYYNWFGESRRLLGFARVLVAVATGASVSFLLLPTLQSLRVCGVYVAGTIVAGIYGNTVIGGVMGDFLGATICALEVVIYLAITADLARFDGQAACRLLAIVALPQIYGKLRR